MPLKGGSSKKTIGDNIRELHQGQTYARTEAAHGKQAADRQAVAIALSKSREGRHTSGKKNVYHG